MRTTFIYGITLLLFLCNSATAIEKINQINTGQSFTLIDVSGSEALLRFSNGHNEDIHYAILNTDSFNDPELLITSLTLSGLLEARYCGKTLYARITGHWGDLLIYDLSDIQNPKRIQTLTGSVYVPVILTENWAVIQHGRTGTYLYRRQPDGTLVRINQITLPENGKQVQMIDANTFSWLTRDNRIMVVCINETGNVQIQEIPIPLPETGGNDSEVQIRSLFTSGSNIGLLLASAVNPQFMSPEWFQLMIIHDWKNSAVENTGSMITRSNNTLSAFVSEPYDFIMDAGAYQETVLVQDLDKIQIYQYSEKTLQHVDEIDVFGFPQFYLINNYLLVSGFGINDIYDLSTLQSHVDDWIQLR